MRKEFRRELPNSCVTPVTGYSFVPMASYGLLTSSVEESQATATEEAAR